MSSDLFNSQGVTSDFSHKTKANFCHAYKVNRLKEHAENRYVARLSITAVLFGG